MFPKVMRRPLVYLFLAAFGVASLLAGWPNLSLALPSMQLDCIEQIIGNAEIVASQGIDVDQDGNLDQVVLYINENTDHSGDPIYILVVLNQSLARCEVVLNEYLIRSSLSTGRQSIDVREIEMVELTGDGKPELHIWLEKKDKNVRPENIAFHAIYTSADGNWKHVLGNAGITQCLFFSSFEFRESSSGDAKDIYLDQDRLCNPPWSSHRNYSILRWDGLKFTQVEEGTIDISTTDPPWVNVCCVATLVCPVVVLVLVTRLRKGAAH